MTEVRPDRAPAKRRPGSGVAIDPAKLRWTRENRNLGRDQLSARITVVARERNILNNHGETVTYSQDAIAKLENGERRPKMFTFEALCAALDCEPAELQEDFPGVQRTPLPPGMPSAAELVLVLGDSTESVGVLMNERMSTRAQNSIARSGCQTIGDLARAASDGTLEDTRNLGFVQFHEILGVLAAAAADRAPADEADLDNDVAEAG
jgi:transcriptional regulator with XRE-family HTH domain